MEYLAFSTIALKVCKTIMDMLSRHVKWTCLIDKFSLCEERGYEKKLPLYANAKKTRSVINANFRLSYKFL